MIQHLKKVVKVSRLIKDIGKSPNAESVKLKHKTLTSHWLGESSQNRFAVLQNDENDV